MTEIVGLTLQQFASFPYSPIWDCILEGTAYTGTLFSVVLGMIIFLFFSEWR